MRRQPWSRQPTSPLTSLRAFSPTVADGDRFIIGKRASGSGTFSAITGVGANFLGSGKTAALTYTGGDGNDIAIIVNGAPNYTALAGDISGDDTFRLERNLTDLVFKKGGVILDQRPFAALISL